MPIYTYQQLKGRIKVGDTVINEGEKKKVTAVTDRRFWLGEGAIPLYFDANASLELLEEKTLDTVDVGDVVVLGKEERMVLDKSPNGTVLFLSAADVFEHGGDIFTRQEFFDRGYTVKQGPQPVIMTCEEAERELSKDGKQVKIV